MSESETGDNIDLTDFSENQEKDPQEKTRNEVSPGEKPQGEVSASPQGEASGHTAADLGAVFDIPVSIQAVLGRTKVEVSDLLSLDSGDVIELDRKVGEAIDIYVNNSLVARGEVVLVDDRLGITMTEIIKNDRSS